MTSNFVDIHPHIISNDIKSYPLNPLGGKQSDWSKERPVAFEDFIEAMDDAGIDKAAIVQSSTCYGYDNSYLADSIAKLPKRVAGVGCVDVSAADAPERIKYWVSRGISGLRLFTGGSTFGVDVSWLDDPKTFPAWDMAGELELSICVQSRPVAFPKIDNLARMFPKVKIVIDHLARADISDGAPYIAAKPLFDLANHSNVYLKMTPRTLDLSVEGKATPETFFPKLVSVFGAERIAFGTNYPSSDGSLPDIVERARSALSILSAQDRHMILAGTAQIIYPSLAD